jgi:hypothetical protein
MSEGPTTHWGQIVPSLRVEAKIATGGVTCFTHILNMSRSKCLATDDFGLNASHEMMVNRPYPPKHLIHKEFFTASES